jgi:hypothetical protein
MHTDIRERRVVEYASRITHHYKRHRVQKRSLAPSYELLMYQHSLTPKPGRSLASHEQNHKVIHQIL